MRIEVTAPYPEQARVLAKAKRFNVLQCGRRAGKTTLGVILACDILTGYEGQEPGPVGWFAPSAKYFDEPWVELKRTFEPILRRSNEQLKRLELTTGGVIDFWSFDNSDDAGRGRKYRRVVVDECGFIPRLIPKWQAAIRPTLADLRGDAWFFGTPHGRGDFHTLFQKGESGDPGWASFRFGTIKNPAISKKEIESARAEMSPEVFAQEFEGIPADDAGNPFGMDAINACTKPMSPCEPVVYGIDLAKSVDWTVVVGLDYTGDVCRFERWQHTPWEHTEARIVSMVGQTLCVVDSTGVGDPIVERLQRSGLRAQAFKFTSSSKQDLMLGLVAAVQKGEVGFPVGPIRAELETFRYEFRPSGVRYSAPEGLHDDCVCALALAVSGIRRSAPIQVYTPMSGAALVGPPENPWEKRRRDWAMGR